MIDQMLDPALNVSISTLQCLKGTCSTNHQALKALSSILFLAYPSLCANYDLVMESFDRYSDGEWQLDNLLSYCVT